MERCPVLWALMVGTLSPHAGRAAGGFWRWRLPNTAAWRRAATHREILDRRRLEFSRRFLYKSRREPPGVLHDGDSSGCRGWRRGKAGCEAGGDD
jgi:hypothetical protein